MFHVGDIITGTPHNHYGFTNKDAIMEVIEAEEECIVVKIIDHKIHKSIIGEEYPVDPNDFRLVDDFKEVTDDMIADDNDIDSLLG